MSVPYDADAFEIPPYHPSTPDACKEQQKPKLMPNIIIGDLDEIIYDELGVKLQYLAEETIPIAVIKLKDDYTYSAILYMSSFEFSEKVSLPDDHSLACMISPLVYFDDYDDLTFDIVNEGHGTVVRLANVPDFSNPSTVHSGFIQELYQAFAKTSFMRIDGCLDTARYNEIERMIIDLNGYEEVGEQGYTIYDKWGCTLLGPGPKDDT